MKADRPGCYYCFKTLDPRDKQSERRTFVRCQQCNCLYHEQCWQMAEHCLKCASDANSPQDIPSPPPVRAVTKTGTVPIKPSTIIYIDAEGQTHAIAAWRQNARYLEQSLRMAIIALILVSISALLGVFVHRIIGLDPVTPASVMDVLFKSKLPSVFTLIGACIAGLVTALVFYPKHSNDDGVTPIVRFIAGIIGLLLIDALLFSISVRRFGTDTTELHLETLWSQGSTSLIACSLTPIYRRNSPETISARSFVSPMLLKIYGWTRLIVISIAIVSILAYLSTSPELVLLLDSYVPPDILHLPILDRTTIAHSSISLPFRLSFTMVGALLAGLATASLTYWAPKHRHLQGNFMIFRILLAVSCIICIGLLYRTLPNPSSYLNIVMTASGTALIAVPLQRALS